MYGNRLEKVLIPQRVSVALGRRTAPYFLPSFLS